MRNSSERHQNLNFARSAREILLQHWWLKLAALLLAYVIWLLVRSGEGERIFTVPLVVQVPRSMQIVNDRPATVEVVALGVPNLSGGLPNLSYVINLQSASEGVQTIALTPQGVQVGPASGVTVVRISPSRVTLVLERVISKDVPVRAKVQGSPNPEFDLYQVTCQPDIVHTIGPRSSIALLKQLETDPISVAGKKRSFQQTVNFSLQGDDIHTSPVAVEVSVEIGGHRAEQTLRIPLTVLSDEGLAANFSFVSVSVLVPVTFKGQLAAEDLRATVTVPNSRPLPNRVVVRPEVEFTRDLGEGIVIKTVTPEEITLLRRTGK
jgi:YbbR domain-containing protein